MKRREFRELTCVAQARPTTCQPGASAGIHNAAPPLRLNSPSITRLDVNNLLYSVHGRSTAVVWRRDTRDLKCRRTNLAECLTLTPARPPFDLDRIYREVLAEVHRAFVFMRFGHRGVSLWHFEETELPGSLQILVVPEPLREEVLKDYNEQYISWILGNGLRDLVEAFAHFLDQIYDAGLTLAPSANQAKRMKQFERVSLGAKVRILKDEFQVEGMYARHFESFVSARNALAHGAGIVRRNHCTDGDELVITWLGLDPSLLASDGHRYEPNKLPPGVQFVEPLRHERPVRERRWKIGERIHLTATDIAEITYMASHEAIDVCDALCEFAMKHGIRLKQVTIIRGGSDDP